MLLLGVGSSFVAFWTPGESVRWHLGRFLVPFGPLYSKISGKKLLEHDTRQRVYSLVVEHPGISLTELQQRLDLAHGTLVHHLTKLGDEGFVRWHKRGRHRVFTQFGIRLPDSGPVLSASQKELLRIVKKHPGISNAQIARTLGTSRQAVNHNVKRLCRLELIEVKKVGRRNELYAIEVEAEEV